MASLNHTHAPADAASFGAAISAVIGRISAWNDARITRKALSNLSDHELDDIGLSRSEIDQIR
jgi:uncharacterized protein YjiS (DUF1127 family)